MTLKPRKINNIKTFHTVIRLEKVKDHTLKVEYKRIEDDYFESANYYENYYTDSYSYTDVVSAVVVNQFVTEESEDDQ